MLLDVNGERASPGVRSKCPACKGDVIAKCGTIIIWHWAHLAADCDPWAEPESEWHLQWKNDLQSRGAKIEVLMGPHRADAVLPDGTVIELQATYLSAEKIAERERFYGSDMIWLYRAHWKNRLHYGRRGFWWKHGAKSLAKHQRRIFWHFEDDEVLEVKLGIVTTLWAARVLGTVRSKGNRLSFLRWLIGTSANGEANAKDV